MTEEKLTKKEMFLAYVVYIGIITFITIFFKEILDFLKLIPTAILIAFDFVLKLAPYLCLAIFFLGTLIFGLKRGFVVILICFLMIAPIYDAINKLKKDMKGFNFIGNALSFTFITILSITATIGSIMFLGLYAYRLENFYQ
ncbi:hypothetical protein KJK76_001829 [Campylobacter jejuni]|nr:hypothetical protein [Campylobacter jejuni]